MQQNQLFVGNLAFSITREELEETFSAHGTVAEVKIPTDWNTGRARGFAFVKYETAEAAEQAIAALNGTDLKGRPIRVSLAQEKKSSGNAGGGGRRRSVREE